MIRRGCAFIVLVFAILFAGYFAFFTRYFEWPGSLIAAAFGALFGGLGLSAIGNLFWTMRDLRALSRAARREAPADGRLVAAAGPIRPLGMPLTSPLGAVPCVAFEYEVLSEERVRRGRSSSRPCDVAGFAMAAAAIDTTHGGIRLLGFPILDQFPPERRTGAAIARAAQYTASAQFEAAQGLRALKLVAEFDDALADEDGIVRKDFRLTDGPIPFDRRLLRERVVTPGQQVCALGRYDAARRGLVPRGATLNRLWPGALDQVRREIVSMARSQTLTGLSFFLVTHAALAVAFYMSETRHAREPEDRQASVIRLAVQNGDLAALERAVRRGANPNARDSFGDPVLLDVREPAIAAALIRLGADADTRDAEDGDTLLIRAARSGDAAMVAALIAAHATLDARNARGETALGEATAGGHGEVIALLRAAATASDTIPLERPR